MDEITRIKQLRAELHAHNHRYYIENAPTISDQDFDFLMHELQELEARHPELADPTSPTQRVGSDIQKEFRQVEHRYPMLSLANTYNEQDVAEWYQSVSRSLGGEPFQVCCEMKYDGLSISLTYKNGRLEQAVTRGDGVRGDDVTANVRTIRSIPLVLAPGNYPADFESGARFCCPGKSLNVSMPNVRKRAKRSLPIPAMLPAERLRVLIRAWWHSENSMPTSIICWATAFPATDITKTLKLHANGDSKSPRE